MAQINKPTDYFNTVLYTGNNTGQSITGVGFQPDWLWFKMRNGLEQHNVYDSVRGVKLRLQPDSTNAEFDTQSNGFPAVTSFDSDGFTLGSDDATNNTGNSMVTWCWKGAGTASSNTDGTITSSVSANTTTGFSIVSYTGNSTAGATVGHGLGVAPACIIFKNRTSGTDRWNVYHQGVDATAPEDYRLFLNATDARSNDAFLNDTAPSSSVITLGSFSEANGSTSMIAYCFAEKKGYSKFGSFNGNASADGTFVYTGFKPAFIITKLSSGIGSWFLHDNKRNGYNGGNNYVYPNATDAELTTQLLDITSNGFKMRFAGGANSSGTSIYMAFAESPLVGTNNIPATAR